MSQHSIDVNAGNFNAVVMEGSKNTPVVIDFWAPWCAPCRALKPVLEKLAAEYQGRFTLAKINSDENPDLAAQFGVRGIPAVKAVLDGKLVDEFTGALPEGQVRAFIERVLPSPAENIRIEARELYEKTKDRTRALEMLTRAAALEPENEPVTIDRAALLIEDGQLDAARAALETLSPLTQMDDRVGTLKAKLDLAAGAAAAPDASGLERRIAANAGDLDARLQLAQILVAQEQYQQALEHLLEIVRRDRAFHDDAARKTMLQVFSLLGPDHPLVSDYRRKLASAMY